MKDVFIPSEDGKSNYVKVRINGQLTIIPKGINYPVEDNVAEVLANSQRSARNKMLIQRIYESIPEDVAAGNELKKVKEKQKL